MSDWQRVRLIPLRPEDYYIDNDGIPWPSGKIVRVKLAMPVVKCGQGHRGFRVHPEDDWGNDGMLICEDQFVTD